MKMKVIKTFRDKYTKEIHKAGTVIDVTKKRAKDINLDTIFIEEVEETNIKQPEDEETNPEITE